MEAKEKAVELVGKYQFIHIQNYTSIFEVKQCALIAVNEIIESSPSLPILGEGGYLFEDIELSTEYWQEVRIQIQKL